MTDREIFKNNFSELMRISKVAQKDLADYAKVSYKTVSAWVCGRGYPRAEQMESICRFFGIRQAALTQEKEPERTQEDALLSYFRSLSPEGKLKMLERAEEMTKLYPMRRMRKNAEAEEKK